MTLLEQGVQALTTLALFMPVIIFSILAFWKENYFLFMFTCIVAHMTGFYAPDIISGEYATTPLGVTVGICLVMYGIVCAGWSFALIFKGEDL